MRITKAEVARQMEQYEKKYGFDPRDGWNQVWPNLPTEDTKKTTLPRAVAYGAYMALSDLLEG